MFNEQNSNFTPEQRHMLNAIAQELLDRQVDEKTAHDYANDAFVEGDSADAVRARAHRYVDMLLTTKEA